MAFHGYLIAAEPRLADSRLTLHQPQCTLCFVHTACSFPRKQSSSHAVSPANSYSPSRAQA